MSLSKQQKLYTEMSAVLGDLKELPDFSAKYSASGYMDLSVDVLQRFPNGAQIALSHHYEQNGDLVSDPDMEFRITYATEQEPGAVNALSYQDTYGHEDKPGTHRDDFALTWMTNLKAQGHQITERDNEPVGNRPAATPAGPGM